MGVGIAFDGVWRLRPDRHHRQVPGRRVLTKSGTFAAAECFFPLPRACLCHQAPAPDGCSTPRPHCLALGSWHRAQPWCARARRTRSPCLPRHPAASAGRRAPPWRSVMAPPGFNPGKLGQWVGVVGTLPRHHVRSASFQPASGRPASSGTSSPSGGRQGVCDAAMGAAAPAKAPAVVLRLPRRFPAGAGPPHSQLSRGHVYSLPPPSCTPPRAVTPDATVRL